HAAAVGRHDAKTATGGILQRVADGGREPDRQVVQIGPFLRRLEGGVVALPPALLNGDWRVQRRLSGHGQAVLLRTAAGREEWQEPSRYAVSTRADRECRLQRAIHIVRPGGRQYSKPRCVVRPAAFVALVVNAAAG